MNTTLNFFRAAPQANPQAAPSPRQRHVLAKAYLRALRLAELREWLATEPLPRLSDVNPLQESRLPRLACLGLGLLGVTAVGFALSSAPVVNWLLELQVF